MKKLIFILSVIIGVNSFIPTNIKAISHNEKTEIAIGVVLILGFITKLGLSARTYLRDRAEIEAGIASGEMDPAAIMDANTFLSKEDMAKFKEDFQSFADSITNMPGDAPGLDQIEMTIRQTLANISDGQPLTYGDIASYAQAKNDFLSKQELQEVITEPGAPISEPGNITNIESGDTASGQFIYEPGNALDSSTNIQINPTENELSGLGTYSSNESLTGTTSSYDQPGETAILSEATPIPTEIPGGITPIEGL